MDNIFNSLFICICYCWFFGENVVVKKIGWVIDGSKWSHSWIWSYILESHQLSQILSKLSSHWDLTINYFWSNIILFFWFTDKHRNKILVTLWRTFKKEKKYYKKVVIDKFSIDLLWSFSWDIFFSRVNMFAHDWYQ